MPSMANFVLLCCVAVLSSVSFAGASTDFAGGARKSGVVPFSVSQRWKHLVPRGLVEGSPAVSSDGSVFVGTSSGQFVRVSSTGTRTWDKFTGPVSASASFGVDGTIYFGSQDKSLYAMTQAGALKWKFSTQSPLVGAALVTSDGRIVFGSRDGSVYALNSDGQQQWKFTTGGEIRGGAAELRDGAVVVGSLDGKLYCIDTSGSKRWEFNAGAEVAGTPLVQDVSIVFGVRKTSARSGRVHNLKMDGTERWFYATSGDVEPSPSR